MKKISILLIVAILTLSSVMAATADDLVGWWTLDEDTGTTAYDSTAPAEDGTSIGGVTVGVPGQYDTAYEFDGVNGYVLIPHDEELDMTSAYTIEVWVYVNDDLVNKYRPILFRGGVDANDIEVYVQANTKDLVVAHNRGNGGTFDYVRFADPPLDEWFSLVIVYDGTELHAYYNGVEPAVTQRDVYVTPPMDSDYDWWLGKVDHVAFGSLPGGSDDNYYKGFLDDVRIWNTALTEFPYGVIFEPEEDEAVFGNTDLVALYVDGDDINDDAMRWAVRYGTCNAATNTRFGNVDGYTDIFDWDGMNFLATIDTSTVPEGYYCFVLNPLDDEEPGTDVRETRWFYIDDDGVFGDADLCAGTSYDEPTEGLGTNRWTWDGESWVTNAPGKKKGKGPDFSPNIDYTYGCSCEQILDELVDKTGLDFDGHYKHGCSKSILEDWNRGTYYVGPTFVETVEVFADTDVPVSSLATLEGGKDYFLKAYGVATACSSGNCFIDFDAEYAIDTLGILGWINGVEGYLGHGPNLLDLKVDDTFVEWGLYSPLHEYTIPKPGTGFPVSFVIYDIFYTNNGGSLNVDIIEDKWVTLW